ncbi:MAG: invasion associated locus B family protein [Pseudomonadota bacterium]|nr:invasion associated locus B family protein [Pseudomonadota bacterium]
MLKYLLVFGGLLLSVSAHAAEMPKVLGEYGDWTAWTYNDRGNLICYMSSTPKKDEGKYTKRGDIYTIITHRPAEKTFDEVSFVAGYTFDAKAPFTIKIGDKVFKNTFTEGTKGWMVSAQEDRNLVTAMKRGERMIVDGKSSRGTATKDTYSLKGFTSAYQAISAKCKKK